MKYDGGIDRSVTVSAALCAPSPLDPFQSEKFNAARPSFTWFVVDGTHHQRTAEAWLANLDRHWHAARRVLTVRQLREWRVFFLACSELFGFAEGREWYVSHYLLQHA